ncbi:hypothetical protein JCM10213_001058 [Rhodosporidiobolus nylandii]
MDKLPDEIVLRIAAYLEAHRRRSAEASSVQAGFAALACTSRRYSRLLTSDLYTWPRFFDARQVERWVRTYAGVVTPFSRARTPWPPLVHKAATLRIHLGALQTLPRLDPVFLELFPLSNLASLTLSSCRLDSNFLPALVGPVAPLRYTIRRLKLHHCVEKDPPSVSYFEVTLSFLLEAGMLLGEPLHDEPFNFEELQVVDEAGEIMDYADDPYAWDSAYDEQRELAMERCDTVWEFFSQIWRPSYTFEAWPVAQYPSCHPFSSLVYLALQIKHPWHLSLILCTSSFPSLRKLILTKLTDVEVQFELVQYMRCSITRKPGIARGLLLPPMWNADAWATLSALANLQLQAGQPLPPLSQAEMDEDVELPYRGPKLKLLDLSKASVTVTQDD